LPVVGSGWVKPFPLPWPGSSPHARAGLVDSPTRTLPARETVHIRVGSKTASFFRKNRSLFTEAAQPVVELIYQGIHNLWCDLSINCAIYWGI